MGIASTLWKVLREDEGDLLICLEHDRGSSGGAIHCKDKKGTIAILVPQLLLEAQFRP